MSITPIVERPTARNPAIHPDLTPELSTRLAAQVRDARALLREIAESHAPAALANSLGAEDMLLTDLILGDGLPIEIFTLDTGRLPPETYDLMAAAEAHYRIRFTVYCPEHTALEAYVRTHGINAFYSSVALRKACCQVRKVEPLGRALAGKRAWITGMRAAQSATRERLAVRSFDAAHGLEKFNPLADWSEADVWAYIHLHGVPYNVLHERFYPSIGCAPCTRAVSVGEDIRAGRWWWEAPEEKECGLHRG